MLQNTESFVLWEKCVLRQKSRNNSYTTLIVQHVWLPFRSPSWCPLHSMHPLSPLTNPPPPPPPHYSLSFIHSHCEPHPHSQTQHTQLHHSQLMILTTLPSHIQSSHDKWLMEWSLTESICVDMRDFGSSLIPVPLMIFVFAHRLCEQQLQFDINLGLKKGSQWIRQKCQQQEMWKKEYHQSVAVTIVRVCVVKQKQNCIHCKLSLQDCKMLYFTMLKRGCKVWIFFHTHQDWWQ